MYTLHSASLPPYDAELSRHAAERYAVLTAVKDGGRGSVRLASPRSSATGPAASRLISPASPRC